MYDEQDICMEEVEEATHISDQNVFSTQSPPPDSILVKVLDSFDVLLNPVTATCRFVVAVTLFCELVLFIVLIYLTVATRKQVHC